jgi:hypothetical protein
LECEWWIHIEFWDTPDGIKIDLGATYYFLMGNDCDGSNDETESDPTPILDYIERASKKTKDKFREFFDSDEASKRCRDKLERIINNAEFLALALENVRFYDMTSVRDNSAISEFPILAGANPWTGGRFEGTVDQLFTTVGAISIPENNPVAGPGGIYAIGGQNSAFFSGDHGMQNLMHELYHYLTGKSDDKIVEDFGIPIGPNQSASGAVTQWFQEKCPDTPPAKKGDE